MRAGAEVVYQATFLDGDLVAHADFFRKVPARRSRFGDYAYEVFDTKLARCAKSAHVLQLSFHGELLAKAQDATLEHMHVVLGTRETASFATRDYVHYFRRVRLKPATKVVGPLPDVLSLGKPGPLSTEVLKQALLRVGETMAAGEPKYRTLQDYLEKQPPRRTATTPSTSCSSASSPRLLDTHGRRPDEMALISTLCRLGSGSLA